MTWWSLDEDITQQSSLSAPHLWGHRQSPGSSSVKLSTFPQQRLWITHFTHLIQVAVELQCSSSGVVLSKVTGNFFWENYGESQVWLVWLHVSWKKKARRKCWQCWTIDHFALVQTCAQLLQSLGNLSTQHHQMGLLPAASPWTALFEVIQRDRVKAETTNEANWETNLHHPSFPDSSLQ